MEIWILPKECNFKKTKVKNNQKWKVKYMNEGG